MTTTYKVWLDIEEYDSVTEDGTNVDAPGAALAEFATHEAAYAFTEVLYRAFAGIEPPSGLLPSQEVRDAIEYCIGWVQEDFAQCFKADVALCGISDEEADLSYENRMRGLRLIEDWLRSFDVRR